MGETPWHGLGESLDPNSKFETWLKAAGMAWTAECAGVQFTIPDSGVKAFGGNQVIYRSDTYAPLSIVSTQYKIVQPREVLEFFKDLSDSVGFRLEVAGCLDEGRKFWGLARTGEDAAILGRDRVQGYVLLATSVDGTMRTMAAHTSVRVVCNNTLQIARHAGDKVQISHRTVFDPQQIKQKLGLMKEEWELFEVQADRLARTKIATKGQVKQFLVDVFGGDMGKPYDDQPSKAAMGEVYRLFQDAPGSGLESARNTAWGLVNAVTRYADFGTKARNDNNRLRSAWFGDGAELKSKAWDAAMKLAA